MFELRREIALGMMLVFAAGCGSDDGTTVDSADGELEEPRRKGPPYKAAAVTAAGTITGTVSLMDAAQPAAAPATAPAAGGAPSTAPAAPDGAPATPASTAARPAPARACAPPPATSFVVFLEDIATGLPVPGDASRRHQLSIGECELTPAISLATAGGTVNISNSLNRVHRVDFTFEGMKNPMFRVPFSDHGQLVPSERVLAIPGVVDVASDQHPAARARIVVLEHPYGVLTTNGTFRLDSVPPGNYSLVALSATGRAQAKVQVQAGATTDVKLQLPPR